MSGNPGEAFQPTGGGGGAGSVQRVENDYIEVTIDGYNFALVDEVEYDVTGNITQMTSQCGRTETRRNGDLGVTLTVSGICWRSGMEQLKQMRKIGDPVEVTSEVYNGQLFVQDLTITQTSDIKKYEDADSGKKELAFVFTVQLKSQTNE